MREFICVCGDRVESELGVIPEGWLSFRFCAKLKSESMATCGQITDIFACTQKCAERKLTDLLTGLYAQKKLAPAQPNTGAE